MPNHVSYLDGPLIAAFLPGYPMFAIDTAQAAKWWVRPLLAGADIYRDGPDPADGDEIADPGAARGAAMRDLSRGAAQHHRRRADEDL